MFRAARLTELGLPSLSVVQHNLARNERGATRGVHAEPWDKYVTVLTGRVFQAIVDLRPGAGFGGTAWVELSPGQALFVPRGCGNAYQALEPDTLYSYLVNGYWSAQAGYPAIDAYDPDLAIPWPIGPTECIRSAKDAANPPFAEVARELATAPAEGARS